MKIEFYRYMISMITPARTRSVSGLKSKLLKLSYEIKMMVKSSSIDFFQISLAPSEIHANW